MNLAQLLAMSVTPLSEYTPQGTKKRKRGDKAPPEGSNRNRHNEARKRYCEVMGDGWKSTPENTEGICRWNTENGFRRIRSSYPTLSKWAKAGIVEMRVVSEAIRGRAAEFEWKWKTEETP